MIDADPTTRCPADFRISFDAIRIRSAGMLRAPDQAFPHRRPAFAMYLITLILSLVIVSSGLALVSMQRSGSYVDTTASASENASHLSQAGIEWITYRLNQTPGWRDSAGSSLTANMNNPLAGYFAVTVSDEDGDLSNNETDPVFIKSTALVKLRSGFPASRTFTAIAVSNVHPVLDYAIFATGSIYYEGSSVAGPIYAVDQINAGGLLFHAPSDDAIFAVPSSGRISSTLKPANPDAILIEPPQINTATYTDVGKVLVDDTAGSGLTLEQMNLTATDATGLAKPDANGIYIVKSNSYTIDLANIHVRGTLVIIAPNALLINMQGGMWFEPGAGHNPTLIVAAPKAALQFEADAELKESKVDFNEDGNVGDSFPSLMSGLIGTKVDEVRLATGDYELSGTWIGNNFTMNYSCGHIDDSQTLRTYPPGEFFDDTLTIAPGSFREVMD